MKTTRLFLLSLLILLSGCDKQETLCIFNEQSDSGKKCNVGDTIFFAPSTFGNEQYPLLMIATGCDMTKPVYFNNGGVICIRAKDKNVIE